MMRGGGPPFVDKRCGLPLALPLLAKKLCPGLSLSRWFGHRVLACTAGKMRRMLPGISAVANAYASQQQKRQ